MTKHCRLPVRRAFSALHRGSALLAILVTPLMLLACGGSDDTRSASTRPTSHSGGPLWAADSAGRAGGPTDQGSAPTRAPIRHVLPGHPADTSANVHPGLPATDRIRACCARLLSVNPPVREVWDWNNGDPSKYGRHSGWPSGRDYVHKGVYFPADRQPDSRYVAGTRSLSWFETNHPDWLEFTCAARGRTESQAIADGDLAYDFNQRHELPLNTATPVVLSWEETHIWGPQATSGKYQALDFDNFEMANNRTRGGRPCGHYSDSGAWVSQYNGTSDDPSWRAHEIRLAASLQSWLHAHYPNVALAGNLSWSDGYLSDQLSLLSHFDLWFDEQGFTDGNNGANGFLDKAWTDHVAAVEAVVNAGHGWQDINQEPVSFANTTKAQRQWALGNYLLLKNNASWIYICGKQEYGTLLVAPEYAAAQVGTPTDTYYADQGVYRRDFSNGLVFVNPSSTNTYTVTIPANTYRDLYGNGQGPTITLPPASAITLLRA